MIIQNLGTMSERAQLPRGAQTRWFCSLVSKIDNSLVLNYSSAERSLPLIALLNADPMIGILKVQLRKYFGAAGKHQNSIYLAR